MSMGVGRWTWSAIGCAPGFHDASPGPELLDFGLRWQHEQQSQRSPAEHRRDAATVQGTWSAPSPRLAIAVGRALAKMLCSHTAHVLGAVECLGVESDPVGEQPSEFRVVRPAANAAYPRPAGWTTADSSCRRWRSGVQDERWARRRRHAPREDQSRG